MGKLEIAHAEVIDCGFRRISMAISDDKNDGCGVRGKSGGVLQAAARRTVLALETEAQEQGVISLSVEVISRLGYRCWV